MTALDLVRWALYVVLGLLFGLPAAAALLGLGEPPAAARRVVLALAAAAIPLSMAGFAVLVAAMAGTSVGDLDPPLVLELATGSPLGWACLVRIVALLAVCLLAGLTCRRSGWLLAASGAALGTLTWSGHGAAGEGLPGLLRIMADLVHLAAASIWLGALALFTAMLLLSHSRAELLPSLTRFAGQGSALVAALVLSGAANLLFISEPEHWPAMIGTPYGRLLLLKLALFGAMLMLAAANRFLLVPRMAQRVGGRSGSPRIPLSLSIGLEFCFALGVLLIVALLGQLDPFGGG